jgi:hypothetical protein
VILDERAGWRADGFDGADHPDPASDPGSLERADASTPDAFPPDDVGIDAPASAPAQNGNGDADQRPREAATRGSTG